MCSDAPESTTNSLSSVLRVKDEGRHQFSEYEKNVFSPSISGYILPFSVLLHVGGMSSATEQDSSIGLSTLEKVQDRVQLEMGREEQREGETRGKSQNEEASNEEQTLNRSSWMT